MLPVLKFIVSGNGHASIEEQSIGPKLLVQSSSAHDLHHLGFISTNQKAISFAVARSSPNSNISSAEYSRSGTRLISSVSTRGLSLRQVRNPIGDILRVDEEKPTLGSHNQKPIECLVIRMLRRHRAQNISTRSPDNRDTRMRGLAGETDERKNDGDDDALQRAEK